MSNNIKFELRDHSDIYSGVQLFFYKEIIGFLLVGNMKIENSNGIFEISKGESFLLERGNYLIKSCSKSIVLLIAELPLQFIIGNNFSVNMKPSLIKNIDVAIQKCDSTIINELKKIELKLQAKNENSSNNEVFINVLKQLFSEHGNIARKLLWISRIDPNFANFMDDVFNNMETVIRIDHFSKKHNISLFQLIRLFNRYFKLTPTQWITINKMRLAKYLIYTTNLKVFEIANKVGYNDTSNFITKYKKIFRITPLTERKLKNGIKQ